MSDRALARALQRAEIASVRSFLFADPAESRRLGAGVTVRGGVACLFNASFPIALLHRAIGFGSLARADTALLERIVRAYAAHRLPARVELAEGVAPAAAARLLERAGFQREQESHRVHVLETRRAPAPPAIESLRIDRCAARDAARFGRAVRIGFEADGSLGRYFERASAAHVRRYERSVVALLPTIDGEIAGTAMLSLTPGVAGLYSGSVFPVFRGRGIQLALIAERVRLGLERGRRVFTSQTEGDNASAHNLRDMGFRPLYDTSYWIKQTAR